MRWEQTDMAAAQITELTKLMSLSHVVHGQHRANHARGLTHWILPTICLVGYYYLSFTEEETQAYRV